MHFVCAVSQKYLSVFLGSCTIRPRIRCAFWGLEYSLLPVDHESALSV